MDLDELKSEWAARQANFTEDYAIVHKFLLPFPYIIILTTALELELGVAIDKLAAESSVSRIADRCGLRRDHLLAMLRVLKDMGLIVIGELESVRLLPAGRRLLSGSDAKETVLPLVLLYQLVRHMLPDYTGILSGEKPGQIMEWPPQSVESSKLLEQFMSVSAHYVSAWLDDTVDFSALGHILDVGGGDGSIAGLLCRKHSQLRADILNLPVAESIVKSKSRSLDVDDQLNFLPVDFLDQDLPHGYDMILFVRMLCDWHDQTVIRLLTQAGKRLVKDGRVCVCEGLSTEGRAWDADPWSVFLDTLVSNYQQHGPRSFEAWERLARLSGLEITSVRECQLHPIIGLATLTMVPTRRG